MAVLYVEWRGLLRNWKYSKYWDTVREQEQEEGPQSNIEIESFITFDNLSYYKHYIGLEHKSQRLQSSSALINWKNGTFATTNCKTNGKIDWFGFYLIEKLHYWHLVQIKVSIIDTATCIKFIAKFETKLNYKYLFGLEIEF